MSKVAKLSVVIALMVSSCSLWAEIYHYKNSNGKKIYVNRLSQVPPQYRSQLEKRVIIEKKISKQEQKAYELEADKYEKNLIIRNNISALTKAKLLMKTKVVIRGNQVLVPVKVKYKGRRHELSLLLDTGASSTVVHLDNISNFSSAGKRHSYARVAGGGLIKFWPVMVNEMAFGPYNISSKEILMIEHKGRSDIDGLLGMDLLARSHYNIDFKGSNIVWNKDDYEKIEAQINSLKLMLKD